MKQDRYYDKDLVASKINDYCLDTYGVVASELPKEIRAEVAEMYRESV